MYSRFYEVELYLVPLCFQKNELGNIVVVKEPIEPHANK